MNSELQKAIQETGYFSEAKLRWVQDEFKGLGYSKNDFLLEEGEVSKCFFFLTLGTVYEYELDQDGEQKIHGLYTQDNWVINHKSFTTQKPSDTYIKAYTDCKVYKLTIHSMHALIDKSQASLPTS
ncbi:MAG: cyclic nucleotide-binding domain-containing protein [Balneolaceae bacterium]